MPVHLDTHEPDVDLTPGTAKSEIVSFLYREPEFGFKPKELEAALELRMGRLRRPSHGSTVRGSSGKLRIVTTTHSSNGRISTDT